MMRDFTKRLLLLGALLTMSMSVYAESDDGKDDDDLIESQQEMAKELEQLKASIAQLRTEMSQISDQPKQEESKESKKKSLYTPNVYGVVMAAFNVSTYNGISRFNVRNSRFGVKGQASRDLGYVVQVDFHNQGSVSILDSYVKYNRGGFNFQLGQQQIHLTSDLDRGPSSNIFSTRSLAAIYSTAYVGTNSDGSQYINTLGSRDIGAYMSYKIDGDMPITISGGVFNGTGINSVSWDNKANYTARVTVGGNKGLFMGASYYTGQTPTANDVDIYSCEVRYSSDSFMVESLYQNRVVSDGSNGENKSMGFVVAQGQYIFETPKSTLLDHISPALRWDHGNNAGYLNLVDETVDYSLSFVELVNLHRITAAVNFGLKGTKLRSRLSVGYEKFFMNYSPADIEFNPLTHDKFTVALIAAF